MLTLTSKETRRVSRARRKISQKQARITIKQKLYDKIYTKRTAKAWWNRIQDQKIVILDNNQEKNKNIASGARNHRIKSSRNIFKHTM